MIRILAWILISVSATATVYNATTEQCGDNPTITASGRQILPEKVQELRIVAMERTMMSRNETENGLLRIRCTLAMQGRTRLTFLCQRASSWAGGKG